MKVDIINKPIVFVICDGLGHAFAARGNAVQLADMRALDFLMRHYPSAYLAAAGKFVGLLPGFIGNSEVGHITLGAGRIVKSSILRFHELITSGRLVTHATAKLLRDFAQTKKALHIVGLLSDGGVHSHEFHMYGMLDFAVQCGIKNIIVHPILDGRDVAPRSAAVYLQRLELKLQTLRYGRIGSLQGRFYAMDRDKNWERTAAAYDMLCGVGNVVKSDWQTVLAASYAAGITDEFVQPVLLNQDDSLIDDDAVFFINVRPDRAIQLTQRFLSKDFLLSRRRLAFVLTGFRYDKHFCNPVMLEPELVQETFLDIMEKEQPDRPVFLLAETEKYAHVTYFFRGMRDEHVKQETRVIIPSLKMRDYIAHPEMAARDITRYLFDIMDKNHNALCIVNYANPDMVGHSGDLAATIRACRIIDEQLNQIYELVVQKMNGILIITADHGNAEEKLDVAGNAKTAHTTNPVPFVLVAKELEQATHLPRNLAVTHGIAHVVPTLLDVLSIERPVSMVDSLVLPLL
ncbi:2,3-bisphosphoglycerate-independent phosphoglycerate mutase [Candidatus Dependentiae bacterium]|nr:2,3-bisphosphoglycerate-independent phosphoglycerate mutase [Candidatus Dependentiae bacterium]